MTLDLDKLENLHQSTTPGPWAWDASRFIGLLTGKDGRRIAQEITAYSPTSGEWSTGETLDADKAWIVAAHEAFPAMLDRIRELTDFLARTRDECSRLRSIVRANNPLEFGN